MHLHVIGDNNILKASFVRPLETDRCTVYTLCSMSTYHTLCIVVSLGRPLNTVV